MSLKSSMKTAFSMSKPAQKDNIHNSICILHWLIPGAFLLVPIHYLSKLLPVGYIQDLLNIGHEANFPTFVACIGWLLVAAASFVAFYVDASTKPHSKDRWIWLLIAAAFLFASIDELVQLHEHIHELWSLFSPAGGANQSGHLDWNVVYTFPGLLLAGLGGWFCWKRMAGVKKARAFLASGVACLVLAIGAEYLEAAPQLLALIQQNEFMKQTHLLWVLEETFENLGAILIGLSIARYANKSINLVLLSKEKEILEIRETASVLK